MIFLEVIKIKAKVLCQNSKHVLTVILAFVLILGLIIPGLFQPSYAASKTIRCNVSTSHVSGNYSKTNLPSASGSLVTGKSYSFNMQTVKTWKATEAKLYIKAPGSSTYSCVGTEKANNYFTYAYISYKFPKTGTYQYYWSVKCKVDKKTYKSSTIKLTVNAAETSKTGYTTNTTQNLNMRQSASSNAKVIKKIPPLSTVTVYGSATAGFYKVKYSGTTGYVSSSYISFTKPSSNFSYYAKNVGKIIGNLNSYKTNLDGATGIKGQCVWYVRNRGYEKLGKKGLTGITGNADTWYVKAKTRGLSRGTTPKSNSIACYNGGSNGHVIYVEYYDSSTQTVYFTEANCSNAKDGQLQKASLSSFKKHGKGGFQGFIYLG